MAKRTDIIKERLMDEIFSISEIETIMGQWGYELIEVEDGAISKKDKVSKKIIIKKERIVKFSRPDHEAETWIKGERDAEGDCVLVKKVTVATRKKGEPTVKDRFRSYEDVKAVLDYFKAHGQYEYWLCGWLITALGRRVGDTLGLKWSDLFYKEGGYRQRLTTLKEEKTGKKLGTRINAIAKRRIEEYCNIMGIIPSVHYSERVFKNIFTEDILKKSVYEGLRTAVHTAATECGISYPVCTHSFRKYYSNTLYQLHPQDADNLMIIQTILGHSDISTTKIYIGEIDDKMDRYNDDYSEYILSKEHGLDMEISNSPIVSIKAADFRELLGKCWELANNGVDKFEAVNQIIGETEQRAV